MKKIKNLLAVLCLSAVLPVMGQKMDKDKSRLIEHIEQQQQEMTTISDSIWAAAEVAFEESTSSELLAKYAEENGFTVTRGVAGMPTAFVATYGSGKPVIGILGEFDALPGISQKAQPTKEPLHEGAAGHGCGHNLFGTASLGAAVAIKKMMDEGKLEGTVKFYGTPAEEKYFGKIWMVEAGLFDDLDVCLDWHPSAETKADVQSSLALVDFIVEFHGQAAHASSDPWNGRSASDALELYTTGINFYREHIKPTVRIHYHIQDGGQVVNVVPDYSRLWVRVRDTKREGLTPVYEQVKRMAEGAAIMANVDYELSLVSGIYELLVNRTGGAAMQKNLEMLGEITYTPEEINFAKKIQEAVNKPMVGIDSKLKPLEETKEHPGGGSTDVGDVSWVVPTIRMGATVAPKGTPWHSWAVVACGGMSIGHKGMMHASKALGMTMIDLYKDPALVQKVKEEFKERKGDHVYKAMIPEGGPPIE
ncbi:amidohydrolase [Robertkochia marina]|uniref:Amidohydrolase n=1 Tax=Robertkochia marina TaxID=1227945 RepID=A0A4S3LZC4_9FLAO|nr:amidohydrolase [Robertkochia marina]THD66655.1 amidohydrolase [Robertkochia marina]TRZ45506.1 amidohydrolase [Robertkochia marina]